MASGVHWSTFWAVMGVTGLVISVVLLLMLPRPRGSGEAR